MFKCVLWKHVVRSEAASNTWQQMNFKGRNFRDLNLKYSDFRSPIHDFHPSPWLHSIILVNKDPENCKESAEILKLVGTGDPKAMLYRVKPRNFGRSQLILKVVTVLFCLFNLRSLRKILLISTAKRQNDSRRRNVVPLHFPSNAWDRFGLGVLPKAWQTCCAKGSQWHWFHESNITQQKNKSLRCRIGFQLEQLVFGKLGGINETTRRVAHLLVASFSTGCY